MGIYVLPYTNENVAVTEYRNGLSVIKNVDSYYKDRFIRNRVIIKIDLIAELRGYFTESTLASCRNIIFNLMIGNLNKEQISRVFKTFYMEDTQFRKCIAELYYFNDGAYQYSLYTLFMSKVVGAYKAALNMIMNDAAEHDYKVLFDVNGYVYIAIRDLSNPLYLPDGVKEEVLSSAKVWNREIKRVKRAV